MTVFHCVDSMHPNTGGPAKSIVRLIRASLDVGIDCKLLAKHITSDSDVTTNYCYSNAVEVHNDLSYQWYIITRILRGDCSTVHLHGLWQLKWYFIIFAAYLFKVRCVVSPRGMLEPWPMSQGRKLFKRLMLYTLYMPFRQSILFHCTSAEESKNVLDVLGSNVETLLIPNFIDQLEYQPSLKVASYDPLTFLFASRIHAKKGLIEFIQFVDTSYDLEEYLTIKIAGPIEDDELFNDIMSYQSDKFQIEYLGVLNFDQLQTEIKNAAFTFLTSYSENFGNIILESLKLCTPVITSDYTPWDDCETAGYGFLVNPKQKNNNLSKMIESSMNRQLYLTLACAAQKKASEFSPKLHTNSLKTLYGI